MSGNCRDRTEWEWYQSGQSKRKREKEIEHMRLKMSVCQVPETKDTLWKCLLTFKVVQSCPTLHDPVDYTVHGILQATILEWVAFPFSRGFSQPRDWTQVSRIAGGFFTSWAIREAQPWLRAFFKKLTSWQGEIFIWRFFFKPSNFRFFLNNTECLFKFRNSIWNAIPFNTSISKSVHLSIQLSLHLPLSRCIQVKISGIMWMLRVCRWWNFSKLVFYTFYTALF